MANVRVWAVHKGVHCEGHIACHCIRQVPPHAATCSTNKSECVRFMQWRAFVASAGEPCLDLVGGAGCISGRTVPLSILARAVSAKGSDDRCSRRQAIPEDSSQVVRMHCMSCAS